MGAVLRDCYPRQSITYRYNRLWYPVKFVCRYRFTSAETGGSALIEHMVWLKFDESTTNAQKDEVIRRLIHLKDDIAGIVEYNAGHNFSNRSNGFDVGLRVRFVSRMALEKYGPHPKHEAVKQFMKEVGLKETMALDFELA
jgi:hypothetical protein